MQYDIHPISFLPLARPRGLSPSGLIAGMTNGTSPTGFVFDLSASTSKIVSMPASLPGWTVGQVRDVNNAGLAVGRVTDGTDSRAFVFDSSTGISTSIDPEFGAETWAFGVNVSGFVVGLDYNDISSSSSGRSFIYNSAAGTIVHPSLPASFDGLELVDINDNGDCCGNLGRGEDGFACLYQGGSTTDISAGFKGSGIGINNNRMVVGYVSDHAGNFLATYWDPAASFTATSLSVNEIQTIVPNATWSSLYAVNDSGQMVGFLQDPGSTDKHASVGFLWSPSGPVTVLNDLLPAGSGWWLGRALDINDNGVIVGTGFLNDAPMGFALVPKHSIPPPPSLCDTLSRREKALEAQIATVRKTNPNSVRLLALEDELDDVDALMEEKGCKS